jgi:hypothetical protein
METTPAPAVPAPIEKKPWFDTVVISTPVLLTVIATFMIGRSSTEMTMAQYYRSVAGQNQSKVGDQWGFFQAKRIRGQILEGNADLLMSQKRDLFTRATLVQAAEATVTELRGAEKALVKPTDKLKDLIVMAEKSLADTKAALNPPEAGWKGENHVLKPKNVQAAFEALQPPPLKKSGIKKETEEVKDTKSAIDAEQAALLTEVIADINKRKLESEIAPKVLKLKDDTLKLAIKEADGQAAEVGRRGKAIENVLEEFDALVNRQTSLTFEFQQIVAQARAASNSVEAQPLERRCDALRGLNAQLQGDYKAVRHAFTARRYEDDARSNQTSAYLYEVKVLQNSARSDKHLYRSQMFLFAMLLAQVGVTIATLALAVKRKSIFWLLATLTGVIAIAFGAYVYLDMWPMPSF